MSFDIGKIDEDTLRAAERAGFCSRYQADDMAQIRNTMVARLVRAEGAAMLTLGARMDELHDMVTFGNAPAHLRAGSTTPTSPRATGRADLPTSPTQRTVVLPSHQSKRKEREEAVQASSPFEERHRPIISAALARTHTKEVRRLTKEAALTLVASADITPPAHPPSASLACSSPRTLSVILSGATPDTWRMGFDLSDAYQQVPNLPRQRRRFVFKVGDEFFVWLVGMSGIATMSAIFGQLCDVLCVWLERKFPSVRARHFAEDHLVLHEADESRPEEEAVYAVVASFGWRVHPTKRFGWSRRFTLLGFELDLDTQRVRLTEDRLRSLRGRHLPRSKHRSGGGERRDRKVRYSEVASVVGMMVHVYALHAAFHRPNRHHALDLTMCWYGIPRGSSSHILDISFLFSVDGYRSGDRIRH
ncbi:hypothetical protein CF326_g9033 [Tilletia indica]|nr:hypothetical protein CF326_g9033 [Tilletia indica]